jgi:hypothetical protein
MLMMRFGEDATREVDMIPVKMLGLASKPSYPRSSAPLNSTTREAICSVTPSSRSRCSFCR